MSRVDFRKLQSHPVNEPRAPAPRCLKKAAVCQLSPATPLSAYFSHSFCTFSGSITLTLFLPTKSLPLPGFCQ